MIKFALIVRSNWSLSTQGKSGCVCVSQQSTYTIESKALSFVRPVTRPLSNTSLEQPVETLYINCIFFLPVI